jgi:hypothetical protein
MILGSVRRVKDDRRGKGRAKGKGIRKATVSKRTNGKKDADDHLSGGKLVQRQALEVINKDYHGKWDSYAPEDVADDEGPEGVLRVGKDIGDSGAGSRGYDGGDEWEERDGCKAGKG